jgi:peptidoglycan/LPS O-acetylase OafA/YrhL
MLFGKPGRSGQHNNNNDELEALPMIENHEIRAFTDEEANGTAPPPSQAPVAVSKPASDKITCLDGLRGIACLLVFNYHFLWPWTPHIMLGHGALPPRAPESYMGWPFMPIICLLHRGRPMVAIFFAISGYVLCRHILKAIKEHRLEAAYKSLASSVFRRAFRLYIPPAITMLAVAILAQIGAFRSENDIFKGPDSKYINGTVTFGYAGRPCLNNTIALDTAMDMAQYLHLSSSSHLVNVTGKTVSDWAPIYSFCLNDTSKGFGPALLYTLANMTEQQNWRIAMRMESAAPEIKEEKQLDDLAKNEEVAEVSQITAQDQAEPVAPEGPETEQGLPPAWPPPKPLYDDWVWVQLGGSWEEHPIIHNRTIWAIGNYTRVLAEWVSPFNFGHYHPRYDPHTFTIPMEFRGSIFIYVFLLGTAALKAKWRLGLGAGLATYALQIGRWDMSIFMGGMLLSELDVRWAAKPGHVRTPSMVAREGRFWRVLLRTTAFRWTCIILALYFLSYPDAAAEFTPGFIFLSTWVPRYYNQLSGWMFYQAIGALILLPCILRSPMLRAWLDSSVAQWLGKVSFSFYLIHGPVLHSLGFWIMPRLFDYFGWFLGLAIGYVVLLAIALYLASWFHDKVDVWSMTVGRRIERNLLE